MNVLTVKQVIPMVNLTNARIYELMKEGRFPAGRKIGSARVWSVDEINNWLENRKEAK